MSVEGVILYVNREWRGRCRDRGAGRAGNGEGVVLQVSTNECRRWAGERARQSAESGERERVPTMGMCG
jgi:hypothetical protein